MKQELKRELKFVFEAPEPLHKKDFLRTLEQPGISILAFVVSQAGYIRKWIWIISVIIFVLSAMGAVWLSADMVWVISAMMPLLALAIVCESGRSENYEMAELEMATRFSLRSVVLARLGILGMENLVILVLLLIGVRERGLDMIWTGVCILLPYLMMTFAGLSIVRRFRGHEAVYVCTGAAVCISFLVIFLHEIILQVYQSDTHVWWIVWIVLFCIGTARQGVGIVKEGVYEACD